MNTLQDVGFNAKSSFTALEQLVYIYTIDAKRFGVRVWERGYPWSKSYNCALRFLFLHTRNKRITSNDEDYAAQYNGSYLAISLWHIMALMEFQTTSRKFDDRVYSVIGGAEFEETPIDVDEKISIRYDLVPKDPWNDVLVELERRSEAKNSRFMSKEEYMINSIFIHLKSFWTRPSKEDYKILTFVACNLVEILNK